MKRLYLITVCFLLLNVANSESILPLTTDEYCPNTEYTFTVTIPKTYSSISTLGGCYVTQLPMPPVGGTFTFKGKFADANQKQTFRINYSDGTHYDFDFKKIKSLFYSSTSCTQIEAPLTISAPRCEISNIPISFTPVKWYTSFETPELCFGSISNYEYLLPAQWSIGNYVSDGSTWIPGGANVTVTSDASTGDGEYIMVRPTTCGTGLSNNQTPAAIHILRPEPTFTISPSSVQIKCTYTTTKTFAVNTTGTITCPISYRWDLGANNYWSLNGNEPDATFTTSANSITLTSASGTILPSSVKVTPVLNGVDQPQLTVPVSWAPTNYAILGGSNICTGTSQPFYVYNKTAGSSYSWGSETTEPNYGAYVVQINSPHSNQTTLTKIGDGVIKLDVQVNNACQQTDNVIRNGVRVGGYSQTSSTLSGYMLAYPPCQTQGCTPQSVSSSITQGGPYGTTVYGGAAYMGCQNDLQLYNTELEDGTWSLLSGSVVNWWSYIGTHLSFTPGGGLIKFRLTKNNSCGNQYYDFYFSPTYYSYSQYSIYSISPNPATNSLTVMVDEEKLSKNKITKSNNQDLKEISILDKMGTLIRKQAFGKNIRKANLNISNLKPDVYFIKIFNGKDYTSLKFIKE